MSNETTLNPPQIPTRSLWRNPDDGRLRAGWRILGLITIFYALALPAVFGLRELLQFNKTSPIVIMIIAMTATPAVYLARRWFDKKSFVSLGLRVDRWAVGDVIFGFVLSGIMAGAVTLAMWSLGFITNVHIAIDGWTAAQALASALFIMTLVGFWEELVFRGYLLQNMSEGLGMTTAIVISCVLYGVVHSANPNATLLSSTIIVLFGYLRIYGYLTTGQLWLSIGMHTGWNFFQATVFGFAASGHEEEATLIAHDRIGADWLSGGQFGPEASVLTIPVVLLALLAMRYWSALRGSNTGT